MADYFESDEIVKSYDGTIVRRIFSYVRPYEALLAAAALTLALSTAGELVLPVLVQKTVDEALIVSWASVDASAAQDTRLMGLDILEGAPTILGRVFVREERLASLDKDDKLSLEADGILDRGPYYLTRVQDAGALPESVAKAVEAGRGTVGSPRLSDGWFVSPSAFLSSLAPMDAKALRAADIRVVSVYGWTLLVVLVIVLLSTFAQTWTTSLIGQNVMKDLRMALFMRTSRQSLAFLSRQPVGRLVTRLTGDVETINEFFTNVVASFVKDASIMVGALVVLFAMSPRLGLVAVATLPPVLVATGISRRKARDAFRRQRTWLSRVNAFIAEHIAGVAVVKLFGRERNSATEFEAKDGELMKANLGEMYVFATFRPLIEFFSSVSTAIVLWFGAGLRGSGLITLGTLIAFVNLIRMFYQPLQDISEKYTLLQSAMAGGERVFKLLDADERVPDGSASTISSPVRGHIEFDHVWFAYRGDDWVLRDLSFVVEPGETVAIVGYTGAGKSTVGALLARLWDPQKGEIRLDGSPVRDLPLAELLDTARHAGRVPVLRHRRVQYRPGAWTGSTGYRACGEGRARARFHNGPGRRLRRQAGRGRRHPVVGPAPAPVLRQGRGPRPHDSRSRRGDEFRGYGDRAAASGRPVRHDARPYDRRHSPSAVDDTARGPYPRTSRREAGGDRRS
jgi:ATP-binding cassette subfamily B protein